MNVVLDTNVIIAAFAARGICQDIVEVSVQNTKWFINEHIISETAKNLAKKLKLPAQEVQEIVKFLREEAVVATPTILPRDTCRDRSDIPVIGTAISANVDFLITGDDDLLTLGNFQTVRIISPRAFWKLASKA